ncbi:MAG: CRISPR-associated ring nuclease [Desulfotignum sp.]|nr:CRISPR-associated ring nuclease [Desulfotignum sp.]
MIKNKTILLATLGTTWAVVPELIGFTNPGDFDLYQCHPEKTEIDATRREFSVPRVTDIWVVTTAAMDASVQALEAWHRQILPNIGLSVIPCIGVDDLTSADDCKLMADLIFRAVLHASRQADNLLISLAGGRKTMSADMQRAAFFFGCQSLLHVIDRNNAVPRLKGFDFTTPFNAEQANCIMPLVLQQQIPPARLATIPDPFDVRRFPLSTDNHEHELLTEINSRQATASDIFHNFATRILAGEQTNFRRLYALSPELIRQLKNRHIGTDPKMAPQELAWLQALPKADLHCHFGGILSVEEMIEAAGAEAENIDAYCRTHPEFRVWNDQIKTAVKHHDTSFLAEQMDGSGKALRNRFLQIPEPLTVCAFLLAFENRHALLDELIFGDLRDPKAFFAIGIDRYETLGDLQGSGLMQTEAVIRAACRILKRQVRHHHITYLELRCSPLNCTRAGLTGKQVVNILLDELAGYEFCRFQLIFIASRHGTMEKIQQHINLAISLAQDNSVFKDHFSGFDLAGAESAKKPEDLRQAFLPLMEQCVQFTIHAGEDEPVENIWQAVYHLSADRIGHGLSLLEKPDLMTRFIDRKIVLELCPSSNFQIVGFQDPSLGQLGDVYPLKEYLTAGVKVTVNTDDPGISRTHLSFEYLKAARMTENGLSFWEILQLIRNSFRAAFAPHKVKRDCLIHAENRIMELISREKHRI